MHSGNDGNVSGSEANSGCSQESKCVLDGGVEDCDIYCEGHGDVQGGHSIDREELSAIDGEMANGQSRDVRCSYVRKAVGRSVRGRQESDSRSVSPGKPIDRKRRLGKIVFTNGCFDLFHRGHLETLRYARQQAGKDGKVVVGVNSDDSIRRIKGCDRPVLPLDDRMEILRSIREVDEVYAFADDDPSELIELIKPDVIVKGGDYEGQKIIGSEVTEVKFAPYLEGVSTTNIMGKIRDFK